MEIEIPEELKNYLGRYGAQIYDSSCEEPIQWGYPITERCGPEIWSKISSLGSMECLGEGNWYLITKTLTREEAISKYGPITDEKFGPRGGWQSVTFGDKTFISRELKSVYKRPSASPNVSSPT